MTYSHLLTAVVLSTIVGFVSVPAIAQTVNYSSAETTWDKPVQLNFHASAHKNCTPGALPTVRIIEPPKSGTLTVREGTLTTDQVSGCPPIKTPARVVSYQARTGYVGPDHLVYEVTSENGEVATFDITINVKAPSQPL
jgi:hypothetical protein